MLDMRVEVVDVDELCATRVRGLSDGTADRLLAGLGADRDDLSRLDVGTNADGELGDRRDPLLEGLHAEASARGKIFESVSPASASDSRS